MADTTRERYAVVSCHVERPLDDRAWARFSALQARRPSGFAIAALVRPPDSIAGEDEQRWLERARTAAGRGPLGHHTHWTAPDLARPTTGDPAVKVLADGTRFRELELSPTLFCGGGWYLDLEVAEACAELGYVDCTSRPARPAYLPEASPWARLERPANIRLPSGRSLLSIPTTHTPRELTRAFLARRSLPTVVHLYFHDADLLFPRRRALIGIVLPLLARHARPTDLDTLAGALAGSVPEVAWADVARL
jgi:hypothetical protein